MSRVGDHYLCVLDEVCEAAAQAGRESSDVTLIAVSKNHTWDHCEPAHDAGCRAFGENRVPELLEKRSQAPLDIQWHFIGTLQKNKVNKVIGQASLIHSVDSLDLAEKIHQSSTNAGVRTQCLLQVNTSGEESKHGWTAESCEEDLGKILEMTGVQVQGLMTMAPFIDDEAVVRGCFSRLRELRDRLGKAISLPHLSMGMSNDFRWAIQEGATLVRIGTKIFGARD